MILILSNIWYSLRGLREEAIMFGICMAILAAFALVMLPFAWAIQNAMA